MIDSHCHLDHEPIYSNLDNILNRSKALGIEKLLTICTTDDGFKNILNLIAKDPIIYGTYGIHPHETSNNKVSKEIIFQKVKSNKKIIGVGETGFDFYYTNSDKLSQTRSFTNHIEASIELNVPIIIHSRNAENETFDILSNYKKYEPKILMHCYTGSEDFAKKLLKLKGVNLHIYGKKETRPNRKLGHVTIINKNIIKAKKIAKKIKETVKIISK